MMKKNNKKFLSLTLNELIKIDSSDILELINNNLEEVSKFGNDYSISIASAIVKKILLIKNYKFEKFYEIITCLDNKYIYDSLESGLKDFVYLYKDKKLALLFDSMFVDADSLFDELVISNKYNLKEMFSWDIINSFDLDSYKLMLSFVLKGNDKRRVIKSLLKKKNNKFIYVISKMNDIVLKYSDDTKNYWDCVLSLLNYINYRHLIWDYYNKSINEDFSKDEVLKQLLCYSFNLMNIYYSSERVPEIIPFVNDMVSYYKRGIDMVHTVVFGVDGYKKVKSGNFDIESDFADLNSESHLLNLKIAFFSTIYGLTYNQVEKLLDSFKSFIDNSYLPGDGDELIYETLLSMKSLYNLKLDDKNGIKVYREAYYKYIKDNGIYATTPVDALVIMEELMCRMYNNSIELL